MSDAAELRGEHAPAGVAAAREALVAWVEEAGSEGRTFLQANLLALGDGRFRVRHLADRAAPARELVAQSDPFYARVVAQTTAWGEHRPLKTAPNLRRGWTFESLDARGLWTVLDYLYPACAVHWFAGEAGTLRLTSWRETAERQSGIYSAVRLLPAEALQKTIEACCGDAVCLRKVAWEVEGNGVEAGSTATASAEEREAVEARVPCPEACSMFVSFARTVLTLERSSRQEVPGLGPLSGAELEQIRQVIAAAADGTLGAAREGEFEEPTNHRRIRYLAARLADSRVEVAPDELPCEGCPRAVPCVGCPMVEGDLPSPPPDP